MTDHPKPKPDPQAEFLARLAEAGDKLKHAGHTACVQAAMGWAYRGDLVHARAALAMLPAEKLAEASTAAAALSSLADEIGAGR